VSSWILNRSHCTAVSFSWIEQFKEAHVDYSNLDLLIGATMNYQQWNMINVSSIVGSRFDHVNIFYSNPDYYTDQKHLESDSTHAPNPIEWPTKEGDFFPYSDCPHCFWTGYFTSRAAFKRFERVASSFLMAARQIMAMPAASGTAIPGGDSNVNLLFPLEDAMGIAQHHDAISGTAKQHVADDYSAKIAQGMNSAVRAVATKLRRLMLVDASMSSSSSSSSSSSMVLNALQDLGYCPLLNETICPASEVCSVHVPHRVKSWRPRIILTYLKIHGRTRRCPATRLYT
jgi:Alpha mannosidase middle domain